MIIQNSKTSWTNFTPVNIHNLNDPDTVTHIQFDSLTSTFHIIFRLSRTIHANERYRRNTWAFLGHDCFPQLEKKIANMFFQRKFGGGGGERCAAARLGYSLCQGYKQAVISPPNRIILPVSAPKHMGPHKAAAAPDRHPLLITQRRGAGPFSPFLFLFCFSFSPSGCLRNTFDFKRSGFACCVK